MCEPMMGKIDPEAKAKEYIKNIKKQVREDFGENAEIKVSIEINGAKETDCLTKDDFVALEAARLDEHLRRATATKKEKLDELLDAAESEGEKMKRLLEKEAADLLVDSVALFVSRLKKEIDLFEGTVLKAYGKAR